MKKGLSKEESSALKGVAILLMMFAHCYRSEKFFGDYNVIFAPFTAEQIMNLTSYGKLCVSIFAFVTGYGLMFGYSNHVLQKKTQTAKKWIAVHLLNTMSGYWFVAVITYLAYAVFGMPNISKWGENLFQIFYAVAADILGLSSLLGTKMIRAAWWYISAAILFILLVPVLTKLIRKIGGFATVLLIFMLPRVFHIPYPGGNSPYPFLMIMVFGMLCCEYDFIGWVRSLKILKNPLLMSVLLLFSIWSYFQVEIKVLWEYCFAVVPMVLILFCVLYVFRITPVKRLLMFLGKHSMNIWLVHTLFRDYASRFLWIGRYAWTAMVIILVVSTAASMVLEYMKKVSGYNRLIEAWAQKLK